MKLLLPRNCSHGIALLDCLVYIALFVTLMTLAFLTFYAGLDHWKRLHRRSAHLLNALHAGERWRADVRSANGPPRALTTGAEPVLELPGATGAVTYAWRNGTVFRQALPATNWESVLTAVKQSAMRPDPRGEVVAWRWDVELEARPGPDLPRPILSFLAVPKK
jgi:hypothetical protein